MGPDVRRLYAAAVTALLSWLDAAPLLRRWSAERLGGVVRHVDEVLSWRDLDA
jgi:hypothetical protein